MRNRYNMNIYGKTVTFTQSSYSLLDEEYVPSDAAVYG
jgi:hypothetical protein